jgi:hypothetical protein
MRFGRVQGHVIRQGHGLALSVTLETGKQLDTVREGTVPIIDPDAGLDWHADQYTQETIGVDLAELGWEAVAEGEDSGREPDVAIEGIGRSRVWVVRRAIDPWGG